MSNFIGSKDVAERYGVSLQTVWEWVKNRKLGAIRMGRRFLFTEEDLKAFEEKIRIRPEE